MIINEAKIKYEKLDKLLENQLIDIRYGQEVNIIVDVKELVRKYFRPGAYDIIDEKLSIEQFSSDIISTVSHYRNYFYKKGKYTTFYFLYSYNKCQELISDDPSYKKDYYARYFDSIEDKIKISVMQKAIKISEKILNILPHVKFIDTSDHDELVYARLILEGTQKNQINLILSNDIIMMQLLNEHTFGLDLKGINSNLLTKENCLSIYLKRDDCKLSSTLLPFFLSLCGDEKYYTEPLIKGMGNIKAYKIVESLVKKNILLDNPSISEPIDFSKLDIKDKTDKLIYDNSDILKKHFSILTNYTRTYQYKVVILNSLNFESKLNIKDYLLELNSKIFTSYPLQLDMLIRGEEL